MFPVACPGVLETCSASHVVSHVSTVVRKHVYKVGWSIFCREFVNQSHVIIVIAFEGFLTQGVNCIWEKVWFSFWVTFKKDFSKCSLNHSGFFFEVSVYTYFFSSRTVCFHVFKEFWNSEFQLHAGEWYLWTSSSISHVQVVDKHLNVLFYFLIGSAGCKWSYKYVP